MAGELHLPPNSLSVWGRGCHTSFLDLLQFPEAINFGDVTETISLPFLLIFTWQYLCNSSGNLPGWRE
jgi:hypothetical protein